MKTIARWTNDCQGKKDYDGELIVVSTRYWPRGGGFSIITHKGPEGITISSAAEAYPDVRPSATSHISVRFLNEIYVDEGYEPFEDLLDLVSKEFEAETEEEVRAQVERWVQAEMDELVGVLQRHYTQRGNSN